MVIEPAESQVFVVQPDEGESFWQPVPANGYAEVRVSHRKAPSIQSLATGIQVIQTIGGRTAKVTRASLQSIQSRIPTMPASLTRSARMTTSPEVKDLRVESAALKEAVADLTLENRLLKKSMIGDGEDAE